MTLFDPESDPSGSGFHIIQSKNSNRFRSFTGQGWLNGTQSHFKFYSRTKNRFYILCIKWRVCYVGIFISNIILHSFIVLRMSYMALKLNDTFEKLVSGSMIMMLISYICVNISMVSEYYQL